MSTDTPVLELDYNQSQERLSQEVERLYKEDLCWKEKEVGLELENNQVIKTIFYKTCREGIFWREWKDHYSEVKILLNMDRAVLVNAQELIPIDSLGTWIGKNFPKQVDYENTNKKEIFFKWEKESPKVEIERVFQQIEVGYLKSYEKMALHKFGKRVCDLSKTEMLELKGILEFRIKLGFGKIQVPPPPPPVLGE